MIWLCSIDNDVMDKVNEFVKGEFKSAFEELDVCFNEADIARQIVQLKCGKSAGSDLLINYYVVHGKPVLIPYLCTF